MGRRNGDARRPARSQAGLTLGLVAAVACALVAFGPAVDTRFSAQGQNFGGQFGGTVGGIGGQIGGQFGGGFGGGFGGQGFGGGGGFGGQFGGGFGSTSGGSAPPPQCDAAGMSPVGGTGTTSVKIGNGLEVTAAVTGDNNISIRQSDTQCFEIREETDGGPRVAAGPGCTQVDKRLVTCKAAISLITVDLKGGDDSLHVFADTPLQASGGTGDDFIAGGHGRNVLDGGSGDDQLEGSPNVADKFTGGLGDDRLAVVDGVADQLNCGAGTDTVSVDLKDPDPLPSNCEEIDRAPVGSFPNLLIALTPAHARRNGTVPLKVGCSPYWKPGCKGKLTIDDGRGRRPPTLGSLRYNLRPRKIVKLRVPLTRRGRAYLAAHHRSTVRIVMREKDRTGRPKTVTAHLVLLAP